MAHPQLFPWSTQWQREIGSSPAAFLQTVRQAFPTQARTGPQADSLEIHTVAAALRLTLVALPPRQLGGLRIERARLTLEPLAGEADAVTDLIRQIDLATQRGGG